MLERMIFPDPVISVAVEPKTLSDQDKMGIALGKLAKEDPSFQVHTDEESGQTIISGMGELHLDIIVDRMKREFNVGANIGKPQVAFRETIRDTINQEGKFIRQSGGRGMYGHVWLKLEPLEVGSGYIYFIKTIGHDFVKIGISNSNVKNRLMTNQVGNMYDLEILGHIESNKFKNIESVFHENFKKKHMRGEWFNLNKKEVFDMIKKLDYYKLFKSNND